jgi:LysB family phage lysis regulatory protein
MSAIATKIVVYLVGVLVAVLLAVAGWQYVKALHAEVMSAQEQRDDAVQKVQERDDSIKRLKKDQADAEKAQRELQGKASAIALTLAAKNAELERLKHANPALRNWTDTALPADVMRLYSRPAATGFVSNDDIVPDSSALHAAGGVAAN